MMTRATAKGEGREEGGKLITFFAENTEGEGWRGLWSGGAGGGGRCGRDRQEGP